MMKPQLLSLIVLLLCLATCLPAHAAETAPAKAVVLDLSVNGDTVTVLGSRVVMNYPPDNRATDKIVVKLLDKNGGLLLQQGIDDPRVAYVEDGIVIRDTVNFSVIVPFRSSLAAIRLVNGTTGAELVTADVAVPVGNYCKTHGSDTDCGMAASPFLIGGLVVLVLLLVCGWWLLQRKKASGNAPPPGP